MASTTSLKLTDEIDSPRKLFPDAKMKDFIREPTQTIISISANSNYKDTVNIFDFTDLKMEKTFMHVYYHCGANRKIMVIIDNRVKSRNSSVGGKETRNNKTRIPSVQI